MRVLLAAALLIALAGCANGPRLGETKEPLTVVQVPDLPAPTSLDQTPDTQSNLISPLDKLTVKVFGIDDIGGDTQVDAGGHISVSLVGDLTAAGKTPQQLSEEIERGLARYVRNPQVSINVKEATGQTFAIDGSVANPGIYPLVGNMSLMRAVASAKGTTEFARLNDVVVFRTVGGKKMAALYNLDAIRRGIYPDPRLYSNDMVVVGDSAAERRFKALLQIAPALATPLVLLLQ